MKREVKRWRITVPRKVGAPPIKPATKRKPQDGIELSVASGAAIPKPSVTLWSAKPMTSTTAKATAPVAADWPIASPSERLCRPSPVAIIMASVLGAGGGACLVRPNSRALKYTRPSRPTPTPAAKISTSAAKPRSPCRTAARLVSIGVGGGGGGAQGREGGTPAGEGG